MSTPSDPIARGSAIFYLRTRLIVSVLAVSALVLSTATFAGAFFLGASKLFTIAFVFLIVAVGASAAVEGFKIWLVLRLGKCGGWNRTEILRSDSPAQYWTWTALHAVVFSIWIAGVALLAYFTPR
jgi:hypothetical protein